MRDEPTPCGDTPEMRAFVEQLGLFFDRFGFRRNLGRVWAALYLAPEPLDQAGIGAALGLSAGFVSAALKELEQWGAVRAVTVAGERRAFYEAEERLVRIVANILSQRELATVRALQATAAEARRACHPAGYTRRLHRRLKAVEGMADLYEVLAGLVVRLSQMPDVAIEHIVRALKGARGLLPDGLFGGGEATGADPAEEDGA